MYLVQKLHGEQLERLRSPKEMAEVVSISEVAASKRYAHVHGAEAPVVSSHGCGCSGFRSRISRILI